MLRWAGIIWISCITFLIGLIVISRDPKPITETRIFCAYNRVFVEFEDNDRIWGTIMLDFYGKPIPCKEGSDPEINNTI
jgi:hypothetical protein